MANEQAASVEVFPPERTAAPRARWRRRAALALAAAVDLVQLALMPLFSEGAASPAEDLLDTAAAAALVLLLGFRWRLVAAFALELVPGASLFPSWTAAVLSLPAEAPEAPLPRGAVRTR